MPQSPIDVGPLEPLLADAEITAIHLDAHTIRYEKAGVIHLSTLAFENDDQRQQVIASIVAACGHILSADHPVVNCVLPDGTQIHARYAPVSLLLTKRV